MPPEKPGRRTRDAGEEHVYLLSRVSLDDCLGFMNDYAVGGHALDRGQIADEWRIAQDRMDELREIEPNWSERPAVAPLPPAMRPLVDRVLADPIFAKAFSDAPYEFGLVELDRLVVSQKLVCVDHFARLHQQLGPKPSPEALFRVCLPYDHPMPEFRRGRVDDNHFAFTSDSSDLRFLDAALLKPEQISGYQAVGPVAGVIALVVGFGSNYLNAVAAGNRLVLSNGHHRACALRALGVTHAPMVIQAARREEELQVLAPRPVRRDPEFYLEQPRPPALKDYFDPRLVRRVNLAMNTKQVRVRYSIDEQHMP